MSWQTASVVPSWAMIWMCGNRFVASCCHSVCAVRVRVCIVVCCGSQCAAVVLWRMQATFVSGGGLCFCPGPVAIAISEGVFVNVVAARASVCVGSAVLMSMCPANPGLRCDPAAAAAVISIVMRAQRGSPAPKSGMRVVCSTLAILSAMSCVALRYALFLFSLCVRGRVHFHCALFLSLSVFGMRCGSAKAAGPATDAGCDDHSGLTCAIIMSCSSIGRCATACVAASHVSCSVDPRAVIADASHCCGVCDVAGA